MSELKKAVIIAGGSIADYEFTASLINDGDFIICADRGILHCEKMALKADLLVGDFDSCSREKTFSCNAASTAEVETLNPKKNDTDTEHALGCAVRRGFKRVLLVGAAGTRLDHTLSNIFLLEKAYRLGISMELVNENNRVRLLKNGEMTIKKSIYKYVSALPLDVSVSGVECKGFKYPLGGETLMRKSSLGISNELADECGSFSVKSGTLLIIESKD